MQAILNATLRSLAFLTRLPAPAWAFEDGRPLGGDAYAFPIAGVVAALPAAAWVLMSDPLRLSVQTTAVGAVILLVVIAGALHEDGLADVADGLFGHRPKERALEIMKDSRIGAYGALALILSLFLRIALLGDLVAQGTGFAALSLLIVAAASRGLMAWLWSSLPTADPGGLADRVGRPAPAAGRLSAAIGAAILAVPAGLSVGVWAAVLPLALAGAALALFRRFLLRRIGGQSGDCLGAGQQIAEIALSFGLVLALTGG